MKKSSASQLAELSPGVRATYQAIVAHSKQPWRITSIERDSPSHARREDGLHAIDIAPDYEDRAFEFTPLKGRSPRLATNPALIHFLCQLFDQGAIQCCVAIENNHLHLDDLHLTGVFTKDRVQPHAYKNEAAIAAHGDDNTLLDGNLVCYRISNTNGAVPLRSIPVYTAASIRVTPDKSSKPGFIRVMG